MPNALIRASYVFEGRGHGWQETWFFEQQTDSLELAINTWRATAQARADLLGTEYTLKAIRCSIDIDSSGNPVLGDSTIDYISLNSTYQNGGCEPDLALLVKAQNAARVRRRNVYLRGFWDIIEEKGGVYNPNAGGWKSVFNSWKAKMLAIGVVWPHAVSSAPYPITDYTQQPDGQVLLTFAAPGPFGAGPYPPTTRIRVNTQRQNSRLKGMLVVHPVTATTCITIDQIAVFPFAGVGWYARLYTVDRTTITFIDDQKITRRAVGRPLLVSRGRAKAGPLG